MEHSHAHHHQHDHPGDTADAVPAVAKIAQRSVVAKPGEVIYTCPMHPQIRQVGPGNCPICGMTLDPVAPTAVSTENPELLDMTRRFWVALARTAISREYVKARRLSRALASLPVWLCWMGRSNAATRLQRRSVALVRRIAAPT